MKVHLALSLKVCIQMSDGQFTSRFFSLLLSNFSILTDKWGMIKKRWRSVEITNWIIPKKEIKDCRRWHFYRPQHIFSLRSRLLISGAVILPLSEWCSVCLSDMSRHHVSSWYCYCSLRHGHGFSISLTLSGAQSQDQNLLSFWSKNPTGIR